MLKIKWHGFILHGVNFRDKVLSCDLSQLINIALHITYESGSIPALFKHRNHPDIEVIAIRDKILKILNHYGL